MRQERVEYEENINICIRKLTREIHDLERACKEDSSSTKTNSSYPFAWTLIPCISNWLRRGEGSPIKEVKAEVPLSETMPESSSEIGSTVPFKEATILY
jgi:hypothetical protein